MNSYDGDDQLVILILGNILRAYRKIYLPPSLHTYVEKFNDAAFLDNGYLTIKDEEDFSKLLNLYFEMLSHEDPEGKHIRYDVVSFVIYQLDYNDLYKGDMEVYLYTENNSECEFKEKIEKHIRLALVQYKQITGVSKKANKIADKALETMGEVENIKGQIYGEFIAILGVFSALIFGLFGGFEGIKGVLSLFKNENNFGIIAMYCGVVTLIIVTISFALIHFTGRLIGKDIKSCCSSNECNHLWFQKYKIYTICSSVSLGMIFLGMIYNHVNLWICSVIILALMFAPLILLGIRKLMGYLKNIKGES